MRFYCNHPLPFFFLSFFIDFIHSMYLLLNYFAPIDKLSSVCYHSYIDIANMVPAGFFGG